MEKKLQQCGGESKSSKTARASRGQTIKWEIPVRWTPKAQMESDPSIHFEH